MASKIDELRKLHADKMLDADELDNIAGGTSGQCATDSRFLNVLLQGHPAQCDRWGEYRISMSTGSSFNEKYEAISSAWKACGVNLRVADAGDRGNIYQINKNGDWVEISRWQAMQIAMNNIGKHITS